MLKGTSKFDYQRIPGDKIRVCFNKQKYTKEDAERLGKRDLHSKNVEVDEGFVIHQIGKDEDGKIKNIWKYFPEDGPKRCPVWTVTSKKSSKRSLFKHKK